MNVKIIGLDESGKFGDEQIFFSLIELKEESEADIFINNILNTNDFFYKKNDLKGWNKRKKCSVCHEIINKKLIKICFFKLSPVEQNKIFRDLFKYQANFLYDIREKLIQIHNKEKKVDELSPIISQLHHYRDYHYLPDFCIKSYSFLHITNKFCDIVSNDPFLQKSDTMIKVQIDGGNIFSYWWYNLLLTHDKKELLENKIFINGVSHGDQYFISMNIANLFSQAFRESPHAFFNHKIKDIEYNFNDIKFSKHQFFEEFWNYLKNFYFKNRLLFIGKSKAYTIIPHLLHLKNRSIIYEPFIIHEDIEDYFRYFKIGPINKNLVIHSHDLTRQDKINIDYCEDLGMKILRVEELKDNYLDFYNSISETTKYYGDSIQRKVQNVLDDYKSYF